MLALARAQGIHQGQKSIVICIPPPNRPFRLNRTGYAMKAPCRCTCNYRNTQFWIVYRTCKTRATRRPNILAPLTISMRPAALEDPVVVDEDEEEAEVGLDIEDRVVVAFVELPTTLVQEMLLGIV